MAYVKPQLLVQDMPLTFQMVNVVQDNLHDHWIQFAKWHGTQEYLSSPLGVSGVPPAPGLLFGSHNDKRIPRAAVRVYASTLTSGTFSSPALLTGVPNVVGRVFRQGVGVFDVEVLLTEYYAEATPFGVGVGGAARLVIPTSIYPSQGAAGCLRFECFELDGTTSGSFVETDFDFTAFIYGTP